MKIILILRHAKSSWDVPTMNDHERPLNDRGLKIAPLMGQLIKREGLVPDAILTSTAQRAVHTAELVAHACSFPKEIQEIGRFYPGEPFDYIETLQTADNALKTVMVVGHNPGLEELLYHLTKEHKKLPTGALAHLQLTLDQWSDLSVTTPAKLVHIYRPKDIFPAAGQK